MQPERRGTLIQDNTGVPVRPANTELQNTMELRTTATQIAVPKPHLDAKAEKRRFWDTFWKNFLEQNDQRP